MSAPAALIGPSLPGCSSWCNRHTRVPDPFGGFVHHGLPVRPEGDPFVPVWLFRLPSGDVRLGCGTLTVGVDEYGDWQMLAMLLERLGHARLADAIRELREAVAGGAEPDEPEAAGITLRDSAPALRNEALKADQLQNCSKDVFTASQGDE